MNAHRNGSPAAAAGRARACTASEGNGRGDRRRAHGSYIGSAARRQDAMGDDLHAWSRPSNHRKDEERGGDGGQVMRRGQRWRRRRVPACSPFASMVRVLSACGQQPEHTLSARRVEASGGGKVAATIRTRRVGGFDGLGNGLGLKRAHGPVREWCGDRYGVERLVSGPSQRRRWHAFARGVEHARAAYGRGCVAGRHNEGGPPQRGV